MFIQVLKFKKGEREREREREREMAQTRLKT